MKKLVALILALGLVLTCIPALADAPTVKSTLPHDVYRNKPVPIFEITYRGTPYNWEILRIVNGKATPATVTDTDKTPLKATNLTNSTTVMWDYLNYGDYTEHDGGLNHQLVVSTQEGTKTIANFYVNWFADNLFDRVSLQSWIDPETVDDKQEEFVDPADSTTPVDHEEPDVFPNVWYPHNTVCVGGLEFRQEKPEVTNKWYNFAPIDLSVQGEQVFELVASNMYVIGSVVVTVDGDDVTVEWKLNKQGTTDANFQDESEFLTFFHNIDEVTSVEPKDIETSFEFGQPISIANDLGGDTNVLLYIRNVATYCNNLSYKYQNPIFHPNFDRNVPFRVAYQEEMRELMKMELQ